MSTIGLNIKAAREKAGLNQSQLAEKARITKAAISRYESGLREPRVEHLKAIATALNIPISDLADEVTIKIPLPDYTVRIPTEQERSLMSPAEKEYYDLRLLGDTFPDKLFQRLTDAYQQLNKLGRVEAVIRITELVHFPKYTESDPNNKPLSLHVKFTDQPNNDN